RRSTARNTDSIIGRSTMDASGIKEDDSGRLTQNPLKSERTTPKYLSDETRIMSSMPGQWSVRLTETHFEKLGMVTGLIGSAHTANTKHPFALSKAKTQSNSSILAVRMRETRFTHTTLDA